MKNMIIITFIMSITRISAIHHSKALNWYLFYQKEFVISLSLYLNKYYKCLLKNDLNHFFNYLED